MWYAKQNVKKSQQDPGINGGALISPGVFVLPRSHGSVAWERTADILAVLIAVALPWSTSLVAVFVVAWLVVLALRSTSEALC
jgi:hypothetical protein